VKPVTATIVSYYHLCKKNPAATTFTGPTWREFSRHECITPIHKRCLLRLRTRTIFSDFYASLTKLISELQIFWKNVYPVTTVYVWYLSAMPQSVSTDVNYCAFLAQLSYKVLLMLLRSFLASVWLSKLWNPF